MSESQDRLDEVLCIVESVDGPSDIAAFVLAQHPGPISLRRREFKHPEPSASNVNKI